MAAITAATTKVYSSGSQTKHVFTFAAVGDGDTFDSGLEGVQDYDYMVTADPTTNTSAGCNITESAGVFTFYPGVAALTGTLKVYTGGAA